MLGTRASIPVFVLKNLCNKMMTRKIKMLPEGIISQIAFFSKAFPLESAKPFSVFPAQFSADS
jgi:hypothetical protein